MNDSWISKSSRRCCPTGTVRSTPAASALALNERQPLVLIYKLKVCFNIRTLAWHSQNPSSISALL